MTLIYPEELSYDSGWLAGFLDADGSVTINTTNVQLAINIAQKTAELEHPLVEIYGGSVLVNRSGAYLKWYIF